MPDPTSTPLSASVVARIRAALPAVRQRAYLNAGTLGPLPQPTIDLIAHLHRIDGDVRQDVALWEQLTQHQQSARDAIAQLTGAQAAQVALMHSTHEGINTALWGIEWRAGDELITTSHEHPGVLIPARHVTQRAGAHIRIAPWASQPGAWLDAVTSLVTARTRAVVVSHVSWMSGDVAPIRALADALPDHVRLVVDGAQAAGCVPIDIADGWHAYTISGQKWTLGPNGSGALVLADPVAWQPTFGGYMQVEDPTDSLHSAIRDDARRFETSQEAMAPPAGLAASVTWLLGQVDGDIGRITAHARALNAYARGALCVAGIVDGADMLDGDAHILAFNVAAGTAPAIVQQLGEHGVIIRYLTDGRLRVSFGCWNTEGDVDRCIAGIASAGAEPSTPPA